MVPAHSAYIPDHGELNHPLSGLIGIMDLKLKPFDFAQAASRAGMADVARRVEAKTRADAAGQSSAVDKPSFQASLSSALNSISKTQSTASTMQREVQFDNPTVSLEETMVAMQKAQLGFQSAVQVRNKLVQAYTDIMNMQV
jgi:flagellar hook-basal body complex protein FliE